jgi:hypothetical protein
LLAGDRPPLSDVCEQIAGTLNGWGIAREPKPVGEDIELRRRTS